MSPRPGWRNGIRGRLKPVCPKGHRVRLPSPARSVLLPREVLGNAPQNVVVKPARPEDFSVRLGFKHLRFCGALPRASRPFGLCRGGRRRPRSFGRLTRASKRRGSGVGSPGPKVVNNNTRSGHVLVVNDHFLGKSRCARAVRRCGVPGSCWSGRRRRVGSLRRSRLARRRRCGRFR